MTCSAIGITDQQVNPLVNLLGNRSGLLANKKLLVIGQLLLLGQVLVLPAIRSLLEMSMLLAMIAETIGFVDNRSTNAPRWPSNWSLA